MAMIKTPTHKAKIGKHSFHQNMPTLNIKFCILFFVLIQHICTGTSFSDLQYSSREQSEIKKKTWGIFFFILSAWNIHTNQYEKRRKKNIDKHSKIKKKKLGSKIFGFAWVMHFLAFIATVVSFSPNFFFFTHSKVLHVYNFLALYKYLQTSLSCVP